MLTRKFHCIGNGHYKFWEATVSRISDSTGFSVLVRWGRIGTVGQSQTKTFVSLPRAAEFLNGKIAEKVAKGYYEIEVPSAGAVPPPKVTSFSDFGLASLPLPPDLSDLEPVAPAPLGKVPIRPTAPKPVSDSDDLGFLEVLGF